MSARPFVLIAAACLSFAVIEIAAVLLGPIDIGFRAAINAVFPAWCLFALAGAFYAPLAARLRLDRRNWKIRLPLHLLLALALALGVLAVDALLQSMPEGQPFGSGFRQLLVQYLPNALVIALCFFVLVHAHLHSIDASVHARELETLERRFAETQRTALAMPPSHDAMFRSLHALEKLAQRGDQLEVADAIADFSEVLRASLVGSTHADDPDALSKSAAI